MITIVIVAYAIQFIVVLAAIFCDIEEEDVKYRVIGSKKVLINWIIPFRWVFVLMVLVWKWWKSLK